MKACLNLCEKCDRYYDRKRIVRELTESGDFISVIKEMARGIAYDSDECHMGWCKHVDIILAGWGLAYNVDAIPITDEFNPPADCPYLLEHTLIYDQQNEIPPVV